MEISFVHGHECMELDHSGTYAFPWSCTEFSQCWEGHEPQRGSLLVPAMGKFRATFVAVLDILVTHHEDMSLLNNVVS